MIHALSYKSKQFLLVLIKLSIVVGAFYFIYDKLIHNDDLDLNIFLGAISKANFFSIECILFLLFLSFCNWYFEILKWQTLVSSVTSISIKSASEQSLGALTASLLTPNRIGEYGAKAMYYPKAMRKKIMLLNLLGNMSQMTTTVVFGSVGLLFFSSNFSLELNYQKLLILGGIILLILGFLLFILKNQQFKIKGFSLHKIFKFIKNISLSIKVKTGVFSVLRYVIFSFQFYFLLNIFGVQIGYFQAMVAITSMYLLSSIIPSIFIFDVVIKGSVAIYLFSFVGVSDLTVLCVVSLMWMLNFVIPSIFGSYHVLHFTLPKELETL